MARNKEQVSVANITCPNCGAATDFDIISQKYVCGYCGSKVEISESLKQKEGFRKLVKEKIRKEAKNFHMVTSTCKSCGAKIVFEENSASTTCPFCGNILVRKDYLHTEDLPELIIPFDIDLDTARNNLLNWCNKHPLKKEARHLKKEIDNLQGAYLPYELVNGPSEVSCSRKDRGGKYFCRSYVDDIFVNRSENLDNLLLDGIEPYRTNEIKEFEFAYVGDRALKIADVDDERFVYRTRDEIENRILDIASEKLESKALYLNSKVNNLVSQPVLLPVYYLAKDNIMAAVNAQTGKTAVRAEKESHQIFLPWWIKSLLAIIICFVSAYFIFRLFKMEMMEALYIDGIMCAAIILPLMVAFGQENQMEFSVETGRKIFTDNSNPSDEKLYGQKAEAIFFRELDGEEKAIDFCFTSIPRVIHTLGLSFVIVFLPVILALLINGFDFKKLELGGSAVWFCITVPLFFVIFIKFWKVDLYDNPWIYLVDEKGKRVKKYHKKDEDFKLKDALLILINPLVLLCLAVLGFMVYLTAFGF